MLMLLSSLDIMLQPAASAMRQSGAQIQRNRGDIEIPSGPKAIDKTEMATTNGLPPFGEMYGRLKLADAAISDCQKL
jgi:hypothetical protein